MAIAYVTRTEAASTQTVSSITQSIIVSSGATRLLVVCLQTRGSASTAYADSVVFNGSEGLTLARRDLLDTGNAWRTEIWYRIAPSVTTANVVATWPNSNNDAAMGLVAVQFTGVNQTTPIDASAGSNGTGQTLSTTITTVAANAWIIDSAIGRDDAGLTVGSSGLTQTARSNRTIGSSVEGAGVSTVDGKATAGSEVIDWVQNGGGGVYDWCMTVVSLKPASTGFTLGVDVGSYISSGIDIITRIGSTTWLRYRK